MGRERRSQHTMMTPSNVSQGRLRWWMLAVVSTLGAVVGTAGAAAQTTVADSILQPAIEELTKLQEFDGTDRSRQELLLRNLTRYFALYAVPSNPAELGRLLGTLERVSVRAAGQLYGFSYAQAQQAGSPEISVAHVEWVLARVLPNQPTEFKEVVYFPQAPASEQLIVEAIDLQAFADTGFSWQVLGQLAESDALQGQEALPMSADAARRLSRGLTSYGILILRLGAMHARQEFAREVGSRHLRAAAKTLGERASHVADPNSPIAAEPPPYFREVSGESGIQFRHVSSDWLARRRRYGPLAPTFSGGGVAVGDLDGDDWPDLIYCGGQGCAAFRNRGNQRFEDFTAISGLQVAGEARMAVIADFDNDGTKDVFISYARDSNRLFRGLGKGRFEDITHGSGLEDEGNISGPAITADFDGDGALDLYVGSFGDYMTRANPWTPGDLKTALPNRLYRNLGGLRFEDVTQRAGVGNTGWTQALSHVDFDLDGDQDIYVANDFGRNDLLINHGDGTFSPGGTVTGSDDPFHGMNAAFTDLNRDRYPDIFVTNIWTWNPVRKAVIETNTLLLSKAEPGQDVSYEPLRDPEFLRHDTGWSWAGLFLDYDNDSDDDLYVVNGFTDYYTFTQYRPNPNNPEEIYPINNGRDPNFLFRNDTGLPTVRVRDSGLEVRNVNSRAIAVVDYDRDGDLDVAVSTFHSHARLFRNDQAPPENHWLKVELVGEPSRGASRDAIGTQVTAHNDDGFYAWRMRTGGEGYLGMSEAILHFGMGTFTVADLDVVWPGLETQKVENVEADQWIRIHQGVEGYEVLER